MRATLLLLAALAGLAAPSVATFLPGVSCDTQMCPKVVDGDYWQGGGGSVVVGDTFRVWQDGRQVSQLGTRNCFSSLQLTIIKEKDLKTGDYVPLPQCQAANFRCKDRTGIFDFCYFCVKSRYTSRGLLHYRVCVGQKPSDNSSPIPDLDRGSNAGTGPGGINPSSTSPSSPSPSLPSPSPAGSDPSGNIVGPIDTSSPSSPSSPIDTSSPSFPSSPSPSSPSPASPSSPSSPGGSNSESGQLSPGGGSSPDSPFLPGGTGGCPDGSPGPTCFNGVVDPITGNLPGMSPVISLRVSPPVQSPPPVPPPPTCGTRTGLFRQLSGSIQSCTRSLFNWCRGFTNNSICECRDSGSGAITQTWGACRN